MNRRLNAVIYVWNGKAIRVAVHDLPLYMGLGAYGVAIETAKRQVRKEAPGVKFSWTLVTV